MNTVLPSLLLADDDMDDCMFFKDALDELAVKTKLTTVNNGVALMQLLNDAAPNLPQVLFLDLNMPLKNGLDCLTEIKQDEKLKQLPVIIYSTSFDHKVVDMLYDKGAHYYICKPPEFSSLKKVIHQALKVTISENPARPQKKSLLLRPDKVEIEMKQPDSNIQFLAGGGEMGRLTREKDWGKTSLGVPQSWPQSLRTTLSIILNSKFPMFLFWGPELICFYNDAYRPSLGKEGKHPSILGTKGEEAWPEIWAIIKPLIDQVLAGGEATWSEDQLIPIYRNGKIEDVYWTFSYSPVNDETGNPAGVFVTCVESTEKVNMLHKLEDSKNQLSIVISASNLATWELNVKNSEVNYSDRYLEIFGYEKGTRLAHKEILKHLHPDDLPVREQAFKVAFATGVLQYESRIILNDGSIHWIDGRGKVFYDSEGNPSHLIGTARDITNEKDFANKLEKLAAERTRELIATNESLKKSEQRYHLMVEEVQDYAILYLNREGFVENWNTGAEKIKGYKADEIIGKSFSNFYTPEDKENNLPQKLLALAATTGRAGQEGWRIRKDGTYFWASVVITAVHDEQKNVIGFSKVTHDLTDKKNAEDALKKNALELEQKNIDLEKMNAELQSFAYISSHDLQEPLRKIQTFASRIVEKEYENLSSQGKEYFIRMQNAAMRMQALINDLLSYSRTHTSEQKFETTGLNKIIDEVKQELHDDIQNKNAIIETGNLPSLKIIPFQFRQLFDNLINNSLKFSDDAIAPHIKINAEIIDGTALNIPGLPARAKYCHIIFSDNGIGFEQQYHKKIFELFQRLHGRAEYSGTGIGLAIVKKIVENHGGIITATAEKTKGATFDIYIPA